MLVLKNSNKRTYISNVEYIPDMRTRILNLLSIL